MRINFDRLSRLAGLPSEGNNKRSLYEGVSPMDSVMDEMDMGMEEDAAFDDGDLSEMDHYNEEEMPEMDHDHMEEMIEIDEVMLVQELRRAKGIMQESKRRRLSESRKRNMFESQLKQVIDEEVQNVMDEMNLTAGWVYGDRKPRNSRRGYTNQGSMMPGIGFRR